MAVPVAAVAGGMMALQALGISSQNKQATANAQARAQQLYKNFNIQIGQLQEASNEVNKQIGLELTNTRLEGLKLSATTSNNIVEQNISGNTAERIVQQTELDELMYSNQIKQKAEANMVEIGTKMLKALPVKSFGK